MVSYLECYRCKIVDRCYCLPFDYFGQDERMTIVRMYREETRNLSSFSFKINRRNNVNQDFLVLRLIISYM